MKSRSRRWPIRPAFTLIELVTVIVILGIVAVAVGGPTMAYIGSIRSRAAAGRLVADIRHAQRTAMSSNLVTWVVFDAANETYSVYVEDLANPGKVGRVLMQSPLDRDTGAVQFGSGASLNVAIVSADINSTAEIEFDSFGVPYDANRAAISSAGTITLSDSVTVTIHPVSGFVEQSG